MQGPGFIPGSGRSAEGGLSLVTWLNNSMDRKPGSYSHEVLLKSGVGTGDILQVILAQFACSQTTLKATLECKIAGDCLKKNTQFLF